MLNATERNVYRLQVGGDMLCEALRKIEKLAKENEHDVYAQIARKALNAKIPEPDWKKI